MNDNYKVQPTCKTCKYSKKWSIYAGYRLCILDSLIYPGVEKPILVRETFCCEDCEEDETNGG